MPIGLPHPTFALPVSSASCDQSHDLGQVLMRQPQLLMVVIYSAVYPYQSAKYAPRGS